MREASIDELLERVKVLEWELHTAMVEKDALWDTAKRYRDALAGIAAPVERGGDSFDDWDHGYDAAMEACAEKAMQALKETK